MENNATTYKIRFCYSSSSYTHFDLNETEFNKRKERKFWIGYIENKLLENSKLLTDILEKKIEIYHYTYQLNNSVREINTLSAILEELYTGSNNDIFESNIVTDSNFGIIYVLYRDEFNFRTIKSRYIAKMFYYNKDITENEEINELRNGNSKKVKHLSKDQIQTLNDLYFANSRINFNEEIENYDDFHTLHNELKNHQIEETFYFSINDKHFHITKTNSIFPKMELSSNKEGILIKEVGTEDFVYYEPGVSDNDLCFISINGIEFAGTTTYGTALELGLNKNLFDQANLPKYEILDKDYKEKLKEKFAKI